MNASVAHRAARWPSRIQKASSIGYKYEHRIWEKQLFCWGHLRRLSQSQSKSESKVNLSSKSPSRPTTLFQKLLRFGDFKRLSVTSGGRDDASLARYPGWKTPGGLLRGADYAGTLTFALTGTITAAESGLDVFGSVVVGIITSIGGGTIRDAIFLNRKPFWTEEPEYIWMGLVMGLVTFFAWPESILEWQQRTTEREQQQYQQNPAAAAVSVSVKDDNETALAVNYDTIDGVLDTLDAVGLSAFAIVGAQNGIRAGMPLSVSAICGMTTATFGGLVRDVLCGRPVRIVHSNTEVYAPPALAGAIVYLFSKAAGGSPAVRIGAAFATCMGSRWWAVRNDVKLHTWDIHHDNLGVTVRKKPT